LATLGDPCGMTETFPALTTVRQAAERLGVGVRGFKTAVIEGRIGACEIVEVGGELYVRTGDLDAFIHRRPPHPHQLDNRSTETYEPR